MNILQIVSIILIALVSGCSTTSILKYDKERDLRQNQDFENKVQIVPVDEQSEIQTILEKKVEPLTVAPIVTDQAAQKINPAVKNIPILLDSKNSQKKSKTKKIHTNSKITAPVLLKRQPEIEDTEGFTHVRRPISDPFAPGERVVHSVKYFAAEAGRLTFETKAHVQVNGRKSYHFSMGLKTSSLFSKFYSVDDTVDTFMDFEELIPHVFKLNVRESGKLVQAHSYFDHLNLKATFWEKKYTESNGEEIKNQTWDLVPFSQNAFSGLFYMRIFKWTIGKEYSFRVSDDEKNVEFKGIAEKKEKISTEAGEFEAIKIKALIFSRGALSQAGNIYFWLSDDERKIILRVVAEIKIGKLVSEVIEIEPAIK